MLCATIKSDSIKEIQRANREADLVELNLPLFKPHDLAHLRSLCKKPVIFKLEEIDWDLLLLSPDYVDLPHTTPIAVFEEIGARFPLIKRICSYHNFEKTGDLESLFAQVHSRPAEIYKMATLAQTTLDALRMLCLVKKYKCVGICMGELGVITRILASVYGAPWTYAPYSLEQQTAPGQLLISDLVKTYNFRSTSPSTAVYGLIGDPITQSRSHHIHNFAFKKLRLDAIYVKMRLTSEELPAFFPLCQELNIKGLSVTMPLKESLAPYVEGAKGTAINTIGWHPEGIYGWNTDGPGALDALEKRGKVAGKKIVLIGAGGAAYGIAHEAKKRGAELIILNRTLPRAQRLADEVKGVAYPLESFGQVARKGYDILINCTSVGMGEDKRLPIESANLLENRVVMDIISKPEVTSLLAAAEKKGCATIKGIEMFIQQAVGQYCHWFKPLLIKNFF